MKYLGGRVRSRLALFVALLVPALTASSAVAATPTSPWDPQKANVPQVAWRGEQVRLVKCDPVLAGASSFDYTVEEWSGPGRDPSVESPTITRLSPTCVAADIVTLDPGLARVKLVVSNEAGTPILKHQFLVIWLTIGTPAIDEVGASDPTGTSRLGDPAGDGVFNAGGAVGRVQVQVKGTFPHPLGPGGKFTLPDDWATIAEALADDADSNPANDTGFWDIHDDRTKKEDHRPGFCPDRVPVPPPAVDAVDNCRGNPVNYGEAGPFSRYFGDGIMALGPFDPNRPELTLLSDGKLDADDAPMPAVRVDVSIAPNTGSATDIGGVGSLEKADKGEVYSRDGSGATTAHNLYAPFYGAYIPSTSRPGIASGVDGPARGNNFRGFLVDGFYDYWNIAETFRTAIPTDTNCLRLVTPREPRQTPRGAQSVALYTDEHGEAQVAYRPGTGFYFDNLPVVRNDNNGCDLEGIRTLGTSAISAVARYPYQPVSDPDKTSATLTKTVKSLFTKFVSYFPKGPGAANENARIVVVHAQDIDGTPFRNERVCFFVDDEADGAFGFTGATGRAGARLTVGGSAAPELGRSDICRYTDANGNAAIEVINSDPQKINVTALFVDEGLLRDIDVDFASANSSGGPNPPANGTSPVPPTGGTVSVPPTGNQPTPATPPAGGNASGGQAPPQVAGILTSPSVRAAAPRASSKKKARAATLRIARLSKKGGKKYLVISIKSQKKYETVKIRLIGKNGRTIKRWSRKCRANRVTKLRVSTHARNAKVVIKK